MKESTQASSASSSETAGARKGVVPQTQRDGATEQIQRLRESEERFRLFVENVTDYAFIQVDGDTQIWEWNTGAQHTFGYTEDEIVGQPMAVLFTPEDVAKGDPEKDLEQARAEGRSVYERWLVRKDASRFWARWVTTPMYDDAGEIRGYAKVLHDETQRKEAQDQLRAAVVEKNALVQEVHHRVKNNLQVINSLLSLQADRVESPAMVAILEDTQNRVAAIAAIHEQLYASQDLSNIEFGPYLRSLVRGLLGIYGVQKDKIDLQIYADDIVLDVQQAIPLGLIANELVANALKHAFPQKQSGMIEISLNYMPARSASSADEGPGEASVRLKVKDDGVGLAQDVDFHRPQSMGFHLVNLLVQQLHGSLEILRGPGFSVSITFPPN